MTHFFERRDPWGNGYALWVVLALVFVAPLAWWSLKQTRLENDVEHWLPADDPELKVLRWARTQFPVEERIFLTWDDSSLGDARLTKLVERLEGFTDAEGVNRAGLTQVSDVVEPREILLAMQEHGIEPREAVRRLEGTVLGAGPLRIKLTDAAKTRLRKVKAELTAAAQAKFGIDLRFHEGQPNLAALVSVPVPEGETAPDRTEAAVLTALGELSEDSSIEHDLAVSFRGMRAGTPLTRDVAAWLEQSTLGAGEGATGDERLISRCFFVPGAPAAVAVGLSEVGLAEKREAVQAIRLAAEAVGIPKDQLRLGGSAIAGTELNAEVKQSAWDKSQPLSLIHKRSVILTSALVGALMAFCLVRNLRLAALILFVSWFTPYLSVALVPVTGGSMNMVLVVMPSLLMLLTLSGAIHVANYWKHAALHNPATAVVETCKVSAAPCGLASLTTAIGLASLSTSPLSPVRDFGLYAAVGTLLSLGMVLYVLPALLQLWPARPPAPSEVDHSVWRLFGRAMTHRPSLQAAAFLLICGIATFGLVRFRTETKVIRYFPDASRVVQDYRFIEENLAGIVPVEVIIRFDEQSQGEQNFLQRMEVVRAVEEAFRKYPEVSGAISLADFQPVSAPPESDSFLANKQYIKRANVIEERIREGEISGSNSFYTVAAAGHDLHQPGDRGLNQPKDELWRISAQTAVMSDAEYGRILADLNRVTQDVLRLHPGTQHVITGAVPLFLRTQDAVLESLITSFGLAGILILGVFVIRLRSFPAAVVAMVPNVVPITVVFGLISWFGHRVDIGTMITASIALGIAVDGTLHYLTWFQSGLKIGHSRSQSVIDALAHCGPPMWQTSLVVAGGLLVLAPADLLLISRFGWLMSAMIFVALLADIMLLPNLLASPLGKLFEPRPAARAEPQPAEPVPAAPPSVVPAPHLTTFEAAARATSGTEHK